MKLKNHIAELIMITLFLTLFLSSCSMGKLTISQQNQLNNIDKELNKAFTNYQYKSDSLYIERQRIINQKIK